MDVTAILVMCLRPYQQPFCFPTPWRLHYVIWPDTEEMSFENIDADDIHVDADVNWPLSVL